MSSFGKIYNINKKVTILSVPFAAFILTRRLIYLKIITESISLCPLFSSKQTRKQEERI